MFKIFRASHGSQPARRNGSWQLDRLLGACAIALLMLSSTAMADPSLPWVLRNHYSIPIEDGVLVYAEDNAEWRVQLKDGTILADGIGFSVLLDDGTELTGTSLEEGSPSRDPFSHELGAGTTYSVTFPPKKGLRVKHVLRTFKARPFVFVEISVENTGTEPVRVASIRPVVSETSVMQQLSPSTRIRYRRLQSMGGQPVVASQDEATMAVIYDPVKPFCFGVGLLPAGQARSVVSFNESGGDWHGEIACHYEPAKAVAPGESLSSDPLWISHGVPVAHRVDLYYSWAYSMYVDPLERNFHARGWFTLDDNQGLSDYVSAADNWKNAGINHVLLGRGWEGRPGSLQGAASRFPKNMKSAVSSLSQAGLATGISIDPLVARDGGKPWTTESADGQSWIDPTKPGAADALRDTIGTLKGWGAAFIVVHESLIPDSALEEFKLTRAEAQHVAYKALRVIAGDTPVFPAAATRVDGNVDEWLDASGSVARMAYYGVVPGPLQCTVSDGREASKDLATAVSLWPGPIEFHGTLSRKQQDTVADVVARDRVAGQPMDADLVAPRTWQVQEYDASGTLLSEETISLGGARAAQKTISDTQEDKKAS